MGPADYRDLCLELFGTDDEGAIRELVRGWKQKNPRGAGRKKALSEGELSELRRLAEEGCKVGELAERFGISRKSASQYLNGRPGENFTLRIDCKQGNRICTVIYVDFLDEKVVIRNRTDDLLERAFGVIERPTWQDFQEFLLSRCFPESRGYAKAILENLGVGGYDPLAIAEFTGGRTAEDNRYLTFRTYPRGDGLWKS